MKKGKYEHAVPRRRRSTGGRATAMLLAAVMLLMCAIGGTLAWLTAQTTGNIGVSLEETTEEYKMIPGWTIGKDPKATVETGSEDCYLFVKVEETGGNVTVGNKTYSFNDFIAYAVKTGEDAWSPLNETDYPGIYYKVIDEESEKGVEHIVLGSGTYL